MKYSFGAYNKTDENEQWIRLSEGCPNNCGYCYEPKEFKIFEIPKLERNKVKIMDMNLLCKPEALEIIEELGRRKVNGKVVYYELICGIDYRFLDSKLAVALKQSRFKNIRLAWDYSFTLQKKIKKVIQTLINAGYAPRDVTVFMVCNWKIPFEENCRKMDLCKVWNVKIADCWFDNQLSPNITPVHWAASDIKLFRKRIRNHNHLINFRIDPTIEDFEI